jgi:nucleotide-binding universal stress UspA family protein
MGRWARVKALAEGLQGLPPIEVYKVGEAYFVSDGHHRVSVAKQLGARSIEAYVTEVRVRVPLEPDDDPRSVIIKGEYTDFLERTELDDLRPEADLRVTEPGMYSRLLEHIDVHRYYMGIEQDRAIEYEESVAHWFDEVYHPVVEAVRQQGILRDFPGRTEADLYLWVLEHREALKSVLGWEVGPDQAVADLATRRSGSPWRIAGRLGECVRNALVPDELESGPPAGDWRRQVLARRREPRLFRDTLVALRGDEAGWSAQEQALTVAALEAGRLLGLHILPNSGDEGEVREVRSESLAERFRASCERAGVSGQFVTEGGEVASAIADRSRWTDLVVLSLAHPPGDSTAARLGPGLRTLIRRSPRPLLIVPGEPSELLRPLIAYDGSPKAREALFVAAYIASAWDRPLHVVTVDEGENDGSAAQKEARVYLDSREVKADFSSRRGGAAKELLQLARETGADLILMGGYGANPVL